VNNELTPAIIIGDGIRIAAGHVKVDEEKSLRIMASYSEAVHLGVRVPKELNTWLADAFDRYISGNMSLDAAFLMTRDRKENHPNTRQETDQEKLRVSQLPAVLEQMPGDVPSVIKAVCKFVSHAEIVALNGIEPGGWDSKGKACYLMRAFIQVVRLDWPVPQNIERWIATACGKVFLHSVPLNDAFMVKQPRKGAKDRPHATVRKQSHVVLSALAKECGSIAKAAERLESLHGDFMTKELQHLAEGMKVESLRDSYYRATAIPTDELEREYELVNTLTNWREMEPGSGW
jgi:hypothetical protein